MAKRSMGSGVEALVLMITGIIVLGAGSVILTGDTVTGYYNNIEAMRAVPINGTNNISELYLLFLEFLPWAIVIGIFALLIGVGLAKLGVLDKL